MVSPKAVRLIIQHLDAIDEAVSKRMVVKRPWGEPALTSLLCDLMDADTQDETRLRYTLEQLNADLVKLDGLLSVSFQIDTHEYTPDMERWVTQADLGIVVRFSDYLLPEESWSIAWLLQAKRLYPDNTNPLTYSERSRFRGYDQDQAERMKKVEEIVGIPFIRYLLFCPRPAALPVELKAKLTHLRNPTSGRRNIRLHRRVAYA